MSSQILSLSLRPRTLSSLYGQDETVKSIRAHIASRPPRTWMFSGAAGVGKTTLAWIMAVSYQCDHMKIWGDPCEVCWKARFDFNIHEVNAAKNGGIDELEKLVDLSRCKPSVGKKRVIFLDEIHHISKPAFSMLLKPTEDVPESTVWILATSELSKVPAANQRRPVKYQLKSLSFAGVEDFLKRKAGVAKITRPLNPLIEVAHTMGINSPGVLLQALEKYSAGSTPEESVTGVDGSKVDVYRICKAVTDGHWTTLAELLKEVTSDEARYVRASVAGWLRGSLLKRGEEKAAVSLLELCTPPYDDSVMAQWLVGTLYKICRRYKGA